MAKLYRCEVCGVPFPQSELHGYDSTIRDTYHGGENLTLCTQCMLQKFRSSLVAFRARAVVIHPLPQRPLKRVLFFFRMVEFNAYQFYPLNLMHTKDYNFSQEWIAAISKYLPPEDARCKRCDAKAQFNWCSPEIYYRDPFEALNIEGNFHQEFLCSNCLADEFSKAVMTEGLRFYEVQPPVETDGMCTSFGT